MNNNIDTTDWALKQAEQAEIKGETEDADAYQRIAELGLQEECCTEVPCGGTGYFVKAEQNGVEIIM